MCTCTELGADGTYTHTHTRACAHLRQELKLTGAPEDYAILAQGGCCALEDVDDAEEFGHVCEALATLGLRCVCVFVSLWW